MRIAFGKINIKLNNWLLLLLSHRHIRFNFCDHLIYGKYILHKHIRQIFIPFMHKKHQRNKSNNGKVFTFCARVSYFPECHANTENT